MILIAEKQRLLNEYQSASNEKKAEMEKHYGKKQLQTMLENVMSENWINDNSHNCPHCKTAIEVQHESYTNIRLCLLSDDQHVFWDCFRNRMAVTR